MSSPNGWNNRVMFERYLYDYFRKNDMHETAEIFRREADLTIDPNIPSAIDVPDGFLHEWWLILYDMLKARQPKHPEHNGGPSYMGEQMIMAQKGDPSPLGQNKMNEQMIRELVVRTDFGFTARCNSVPLTRCPLTGADLIHPGLEKDVVDSLCVMEQHQKKLLDRPPSLESCSHSGRRENSAYSEDGSNVLPIAADCPSETSSSIPKSLDDIVKLSSSLSDDNKDEEFFQ